MVKSIFPDADGLGQLAEQPSDGLAMLELFLQRHIVTTCRAALRGYPFHIGVPAAYLLLNEHEIRDLTVLIEAKASHRPPEAFARLLEMQPPPDRADQR